MKIGNHDIERATVLAEQDWLASRARYIGSSEAAALFGIGYGNCPSAWSLWCDKTGKVQRDQAALDDDDRVSWGTLLERPILEMVKRRTGWDVLFPGDSEDGDRLVIDAPSPAGTMRATCDAFVYDHADGLGLIEVKNRDFLQWRDDYTDDDASARDQIQLAHQMVCVPEAKWGVIAVLVGGNDLKIYHYTRDDLRQQMAGIVERVVEFWGMVKRGDEPSLMDERELPSWGRLHREDPEIELVEFGAEDQEQVAFDAACATIYNDDPQAKSLAKGVKEAKAAILGLAGKAGAVSTEHWHMAIKYSQTRPTVMTLPDELRAGLDIAAGALADAGDIDNAKRVADAAGWSVITRRGGMSTRFKAEIRKSRDIVDDIRNTDLGG